MLTVLRHDYLNREVIRMDGTLRMLRADLIARLWLTRIPRSQTEDS